MHRVGDCILRAYLIYCIALREPCLRKRHFDRLHLEASKLQINTVHLCARRDIQVVQFVLNYIDELHRRDLQLITAADFSSQRNRCGATDIKSLTAA